jgi:glycerophosphoryl diester phosphodiesterase
VRSFDLTAFAYAHRGLWTKAVPENSLNAFRSAAAAGLGCELDVRRTKDGELVIFHDATLERMCGSPARISDIPFVELRGHRLPDGSKIPTLREALEAMNGLPTLIEVKIDPPNRKIVPPLIEYMSHVEAPSAVMSFDEWTVWRLCMLLPGFAIGQLIEPVEDIGADGVAVKAERAREGGCAYIAPHHSSLAIVRETEPGEELPLVTWTVRDQAQLRLAIRQSAAPIFEGLDPTLAKPS